MTQLVVTKLSAGHQRNYGPTASSAGDRFLLQTVRAGPGAYNLIVKANEMHYFSTLFG